ncbi:MAG: PKD domain-containing protein [Bacteroidales bacterium]|nr:PKD domain-containing protein [Bacteroidales bacterium]
MKKIKLITLLLSGIILGIVQNSFAQISQGGTPFSFTDKSISDNFEMIELSKPDMELIRLEDEENIQSQFPGPERIGVSIIVNLNPNNSGTWTDLSDGGKIWRLKLRSEDALALGVYYDDFYLPRGSELFLYNEAKTQIIGAFTEINNHESGLFSNELIQGETLTLEYYQPAYVNEKAIIYISEIAYAYRDVNFLFNEDDKGGAWWCMINTACEEGDDWRDEIQGIARLSIKIGYSYYWCSGSLINNTLQDRTPYLLTADHCAEGATANDLNQWIFYFNYQALTCSGTGSGYNSMVGCQKRAQDQYAGFSGSDFYLIELNQTIPDSYDPYYNGWNRTNVPGTSGVCIHHPAGDIKKISTAVIPFVSSTWWNGTPSHWRVHWGNTVNGRSIMQGGSSGSPILDQNHYIMGDLSGGWESNSCSSPSPAWFGKIWWSWDHGSSSAFRLKEWLDPIDRGDTVLPGIGWEIILPLADFKADTTEITQGDTLAFTDLSTGNPYQWKWIFEGAIPDTSILQNPSDIIYPDTGTFDVTLIVTNGDGVDSLTKYDYIKVNMAPPEANFEADNTYIGPGESVNFTDLSTGDPASWEWIFEGGDPETSVLQNPDNIVYDESGYYDVTLIATNIGGSDTLTIEDYIQVFWVGISENINADKIKIYPNPTSGLITFDFGEYSSEELSVIVFNSIGKIIACFDNIKDNNNFSIDFSLESKGIYYISVNTSEGVINKRVSLVK